MCPMPRLNDLKPAAALVLELGAAVPELRVPALGAVPELELATKRDW